MTLFGAKVLGSAAFALGLTLSIPHPAIFSLGSSEAQAAVDVSINLGTFMTSCRPMAIG
jgi:hypothetical protein